MHISQIINVNCHSQDGCQSLTVCFYGFQWGCPIQRFIKCVYWDVLFLTRGSLVINASDLVKLLKTSRL